MTSTSIFLPLSFLLTCHLTCHLNYESLSKVATLGTLHYIQLRCPPKLYPLETLTSFSTSTPKESHPVVIEDDAFASEPPVSPTTAPTINLHGILGCFDSLTWLVERLLPSNVDVPSTIPPSPMAVGGVSDGLDPDVPSALSDSPRLLSNMFQEDVLPLIYHDGAVLPLVCPCDNANSSNKKTQWSAKELHHAMGCRKFRNYKHFYKSVMMVNTLMAASSHPLLAPSLWSRKPPKANLLTGHDVVTLMPFMLILSLVTVSLWIFFLYSLILADRAI